MNQKSRQESKNCVEKDFYKLMNNSNFGYDCRNNIDNCKFVPIFDEYNEITFINRYHNIFDQKFSQFVTSDLIKQQIEKTFNDKLMKLDPNDIFYEIKLQTIKSERLSSIEAVEKLPTKKSFHHSGGIPVEFHWRHGKLLENDWNKWNLWSSSEIPLEFQQFIILTPLKFHLSKIFVENWR